jgi:YfaZ precursor
MMKQRYLTLLCCAAALAVLPARAEVLNLDVGDDNVHIDLAAPLQHFIPGTGTQGQIDGGFIYDGQHSGDSLKFGYIGALVTGDLGVIGTESTGGLGVRALVASRLNGSGAGLALGGEAGVRIPGFNRLGVSGYTYWAPGILLTEDFYHYFEFGADVDYEFIRNASVYAGYRKLELGATGSGDIGTADEGGHVGIRLKF